MIIAYGHYKIADRVIGYRKDWCNHCDGECHSEQHRAFYLGHLYWLPIVPLGIYRYWACKACRKNPRERTRTSSGMLIVGVVVFSIMLVALMFPPIPTRDVGTIWGARLFFVAMIALLVYMIRARSKESPVIKSVSPYPTDKCYYCDDKLVNLHGRYCEKCHVHSLDA